MTPTPKLQANEDGWDQWAMFVLKELERLNGNYEALRLEFSAARLEAQKDIGRVRTEIATLKVKAGLWGGAGAAIPVLLMLAIQLIQ
jgi:hypothetical protein